MKTKGGSWLSMIVHFGWCFELSQPGPRTWKICVSVHREKLQHLPGKCSWSSPADLCCVHHQEGMTYLPGFSPCHLGKTLSHFGYKPVPRSQVTVSTLHFQRESQDPVLCTFKPSCVGFWAFLLHEGKVSLFVCLMQLDFHLQWVLSQQILVS